MTFRKSVRFTLLAKKVGYYATRQHMLKPGHSLQDVALVLALRLRMIGIEKERKAAQDIISTRFQNVLDNNLRLN